MSDLHERLTAAINERLELARKATPGPWTVAGIGDFGWAVHFEGGRPFLANRGVETEDNVQGRNDAEHIAANDPATVIRHCERDLKELDMHQWRAPGVNCGCDKGMCSCGEHVPWPCEELLWFAAAYAVDSALPPRPPVERGTGSAASPPG